MSGDRLCHRRLSDFQPLLPVYAVYADAGCPPLLKKFLALLKKNVARSPEKFDQ